MSGIIQAYLNNSEKFENTNNNVKKNTNNNVKNDINNNVSNKNNNKETKLLEKKFLGLDVKQWGYISVVTNGFSVIVQLRQLFKTKSAKSFDMTFIFLMTILNATYFILGVLTNNVGLAVATFFFVYYNLTVMYFYYSSK